MSDLVLEVEELTVRYGGFVAVDRASFGVRRGEIFGFIGPNGAGKSSTMRVLATLQEPSAGRARVLGLEASEQAEAIRWRLGYMPDLFGLPELLTVEEYLNYQADLWALPASSRDASLAAVLELTDLAEHRHKLVAALSKGVRQRLFLARTLLPEPEVLILDEPASGLDPRARIDLRALLKELRSMGKTILISSHVLTELSEICDSVGIIEAGRILAAGPVEEVLARFKPHLDVRVQLLSDAEAARAWIAGRSGCEAVAVSGPELRFTFTGQREELPELLAALLAAGHRACDFRAERGTVEDLFLTVTQGLIQ